MSPFPRDDYRALTRYEPDREPVALDLSDNTNLWGTHPAALARIRAAETDDLARYPELYADVLRNAVARRFDVPAECVTTGAGSDDVLDSAFRAASGPGTVVAYASPTFSMVEPLARMNGMGPHPVPWTRALEDPAALLEHDPAVVYVCRPNNPTGEVAPASWLEALLDLVGERSASVPESAGAPGTTSAPLVILDEAYADFAEDTWIARGAETPGLLVARTASKAYGLAGLRCGFGIATPETALEIEKSRGPFKVARLTAEAVAAAVRDEEGWMAGIVEEARTNRERLHAELASRGLDPVPSQANFILFPAPSGAATKDVRALRQHGIGVRPFTGIAGMGEGLRVTIGPWRLMERFLDALDAVREAVPSSPSSDPSRERDPR
ncbi:MAG: aminotransferase class I/II-fold pyridoxal phosphate-dependent enzyme [Gemmatimonadota bacterium]|nr:aminotransferase class I/II-fold pyridoxal phosphate-dependent enzyme [Gemmatimonadota bacterium]